MKKIQISPSILSADFSQLGSEIKKLEEGGADLIHVDVMDGHFVPNLTIGPPVIKNLRKYTKLPFDVHLMISPVHEYIENYANAGADIITIHPEATENLRDSINLIKKFGKKVGVSLNPKTEIKTLIEEIENIDLVLIMSVNPGFGGQKFMPEVINKIKELKNIREKNNYNFSKDLDMYPSPYLSGEYDYLFKDNEDHKYQVIVETNRGCPFTCTFCTEGQSYWTKVKRKPREIVEGEISYIADKMNKLDPKNRRTDLLIADSNFGMFAQGQKENE